MKGLLEFLAAKGSEFVFHQEEWHFPFTMKTRGLKGGLWEVDASASSQILSALMMVAPLCEEAVTIRLIGDTVSKPFIQMTADMMKQFGAEIECKNDYHCPENSHYRRTEPEYQIEPDATAASYFFTLPYVAGGQIRIEGLEKNPLQGDIDYLKILTSLGFYVEWDRNIIRVIAPNSLVNGGHFNFNPISDTFLTLAAISPILKTPTTITGIAHTRKQETDRISAMATELKKLGQDVTETEDSIHIKPSIENLKMAAQKNPIIHTYEDHRVAMSFGILGSYNLFGDLRPWLKIEDPYCCAKTFPHFFKELEKIRLS
jgi:3-phosphoshikimate 1-carboxyvinyltransferase